MQVILNHENVNICIIGQGKEAQHRKYKRLKLGGSQAYNHLSRQWLYPSVISEHQQNLLYKTWTAGLRR
jgi:hypothetical protein